MANIIINEDSQINFDTGNIFCTFERGGELTRNVSQILAIIDFFQAEKLLGKPCQQERIL